MSARRSIALALCLASSAYAVGAQAQTPAGQEGGAPAGGATPATGGTEDPARTEEAREQYRAGVAAFRARRFGDAVVAFERSYRARPHPTTLYNVAESRLRAGDRNGAIEQLRVLLAMTDPAPDAATVERARTLAREGGVEDLQPAAPRSADCPACPVCETRAAVCPPPATQVVVAGRPSPVPLILAGLGAVVLATGVGFYTAAVADAAAYAHPGASDSLRVELRAQGESFRWIGLVGMIGGIGLEAAAIVLGVLPARGGSAAANRPSARIDLAPTGVVLSGTF